MNSRPRFSAFHRDSIIDPELTEYLSGGETSEDASSLPPDYYEPQVSPVVTEPDKVSFGNFFAAMRKGRSRASSRSLRNDDSPLSYGKASPRSIAGRRSLQTAQHQRLPSKLSKDVTMSPLRDSPRQFFSPSGKVAPGGFKMTRSSSMRGATAPAMELNKASLEHVHKMLRQLLDKHDIPHPHRWQSALMPILLKVTDDVDPDVQQGDDMDIRHYVKLKRIPGGRPGDTCYVSGLVFTKNLALKSMPRQISRPRILIIAFPLEYARQEQHFMSLEPVVRQEEEFLQNLVSRIRALEPTLLLAE
ncbi:1-phosphatidylinositol-3-phosphate 5-kinase, partial [Ascosphaera atra]